MPSAFTIAQAWLDRADHLIDDHGRHTAEHGPEYRRAMGQAGLCLALVEAEQDEEAEAA